MARTIKTSISGPVTLTPADNPLTITAQGTITATAGDGIDGASGTDWIITSHGTVSSTAGDGIALAGNGNIDNFGLITTEGNEVAVAIGGSGVVTNHKGALISGNEGVSIGGFGVISNRGTISGSEAGAVNIGGGGLIANDGNIENGLGPVILISGGFGVIINGMDGSIGGDKGGVFLDDGGIIVNRGSIVGSDSSVSIAGGGVVINGGGALISTVQGSAAVAISLGVGFVRNAGTIIGNTSGRGILLADGGIVINSGLILQSVEISVGSGTVVNAGTIKDGSVLFDSGTANNLLVVDPGAVFTPGTGVPGLTAATNDGSNSTIELARGTGEISGIGTGLFNGFQTLSVDNGAKWTLTGTNAISTLVDSGKLTVAGSVDISTLDPSSKGEFSLTNMSTLEIGTATGTGSRMSFMSGSELIIDNPAEFGKNVGLASYNGPLMEDFANGATIDLKDFSTDGIGFMYKGGLLQISNGSEQVATLSFQKSSLGSGMFRLASDGGGGVLITHS